VFSTLSDDMLAHLLATPCELTAQSQPAAGHAADGDSTARAAAADAVGVAPTGRLSDRMTAPRNMWGQLWARSRPRAAHDQKPLLDPEAEGEKVRQPCA
jgi:hypothetical protein